MYDRDALVFGMLRLIVPERDALAPMPTNSPRRVLKEQRRLGAMPSLRLMTDELDSPQREGP